MFRSIQLMLTGVFFWWALRNKLIAKNVNILQCVSRNCSVNSYDMAVYFLRCLTFSWNVNACERIAAESDIRFYTPVWRIAERSPSSKKQWCSVYLLRRKFYYIIGFCIPFYLNNHGKSQTVSSIADNDKCWNVSITIGIILFESFADAYQWILVYY